MGGFSEAQLKKDGFKYALSNSFNRNAEGEAASRQWLLNTLKVADGLGISDVPVIEKRKGGKIDCTLYFNDVLDRMKLELVVNGIQYKKGGFVSVYAVDESDPNPDHKVDTYVAAIKTFCDQRDIECRFKEINDRSFEIIFDSNVDQSAFFHAQHKIIPDMVQKLRSKTVQTPDFKAFS